MSQFPKPNLDIYFLIITILSLLPFCKENKEPDTQKQILGNRMTRVEIKLTEKPGSGKKLFSLPAHTSVLVIEEVEQNKKKYYKVQSSTAEIGFQEINNFTDFIVYSLQDGTLVYRSPSLVSETFATLQKGAYCFVLEVQGNWGKADCRSIQFLPEKILDLDGVFIPLDNPNLTRDPEHSAYVLSLRKIRKLLLDFESKGEKKSLVQARTEIESLLLVESPLRPKLIELLIEYNRWNPDSALSP